MSILLIGRKINLFLLALILISTKFLHAEQIATIESNDKTAATTEQKPVRAIHKFGAGIYLLGPNGLYGGWLNYYILPKLGVEAGGMYFGWGNIQGGTRTIGFHAGVRWYFSGSKLKERWSSYLGIFYHEWRYYQTGYPAAQSDVSFYLPLGVEFLGYSGFTFAAEIAFDPLLAAHGLPWGGVKLGWHF